MKLAITGKGGVGKTTLASLLAGVYAADGHQVLAIDADPDANLAAALGFPADVVTDIVPIADMKELVEERTGMKPGTIGGFFKLNPRVDDIPDRFCATRDGIKLLVLGSVQHGGAGCICPESVLLKSLVRHLLLGRKEVVILDMEAGLEHLGRGTASGVDAFIVVVEPGLRSLQTAVAIKKLAGEIGIQHCYAVGCKVTGDDDRRFIVENLPGFTVLGYLSYNPQIMEADRRGSGVLEAAPQSVDEARAVKDKLVHLTA